MSDNPFKDEESINVFKEVPAKEEPKQAALAPKTKQDDGGYSQFPKWDLLPPFKLIKRGRNQ